MKNRLYLITLLLALLLTAHAQENSIRQIYNEAEENYNIGRLVQAEELLSEHIDAFTGNLKGGAFRLLALCNLALDNKEKAEYYAKKLLDEDPYYNNSAQDPPRFTDIVTQIKAGRMTTITTASNQEENLSEVPVPTTLITEEMIHNCGARNLQEVLAAYVPGMHIVDCNDDINIAMRGIYSNGQEKILIMLNGHRLNSYCTNIASPDFSISLEKLKQIEVLRGPASSLYGGVALTGVVNLITKQGADINGLKFKAGIGNYGQLRGDALYGIRYFDLDLLLWASAYQSDGEKCDAPPRDDNRYVSEKTITIGRIGNSPSYNYGIQLNWKGLKFLYDTHFSQVVAPFTISTLATAYAHDKYRTYNGIAPSFTTSSHHTEISYSRQIGKLHLSGALTYDHSDITHYQVMSDDSLPNLGIALSMPESIREIFAHYGGLSRYINGQERDYGLKLKGDFKYIENHSHQGFITFGTALSRFNFDDMRYQIGYDFVQSTQENPILQEMGKGHEISNDYYLQLKHKWKSLILNAGLRYDYKKRSDNTRLNEFSPRIALILLRPKWNVKLSYSKSFVDAPYLYRTINYFMGYLSNNNQDISLDQISYTNISPERVNSFQLSFMGVEWIKGLNFEVNAFFNQAKDQIMTHYQTYENGGNNKTQGVEVMANYRHQRFTTDFNFTWTRTTESSLMNFSNEFKNLLNLNINTNNNTPVIMSNAVFSWQATNQFKLFTHLLFEGKQSSYNTDLSTLITFYDIYIMGTNFIDKGLSEVGEKRLDEAIIFLVNNIITRKDMPARIICNLGAEYQWGKVTLGFNINNLFNTHYDRSGMSTKLVPQKGRWLMGTIAYKF
jgi:iron complex outermembrane receptor protein